ncbi:MAG: hypothetical protein GY854_26020 [Deltaproteobacteria bacterium]|nr:hypothetical protein [Deltaproteobacteria bacterium]
MRHMANISKWVIITLLVMAMCACTGKEERARTSLEEARKRNICAMVRPAQAHKPKSSKRTRRAGYSIKKQSPSTRRQRRTRRRKAVEMGMDKSQIEEMCGMPDRVGYVKTKKGVRERWVYRIEEKRRAKRIYLYFKKGALVESDVFIVARGKKTRVRQQTRKKRRPRKPSQRPVAESGSPERRPPKKPADSRVSHPDDAV